MKFVVEIDVDYAAFRYDDETICFEQVATVLRSVADRVEDCCGNDVNGSMCDINGNRAIDFKTVEVAR